MKILITGGAGYIGSHTALELVAAGHDVVIVDNLSNSNSESIRRINELSGQTIPFVLGDVCDRSVLRDIFGQHQIDAVIHFAGYKAVDQSVAQPLLYYRNNIDSTLALCDVMNEFDIKKLIFSSSATVYGVPSELPLRETSQVGEGITNPYGRTKYMNELVLQDVTVSDDSWQITILRYFNPIGAHHSGRIGEDPNGKPNNLFPYITQVAVGRREKLSVFGDDYQTPDGTAIRDYIHVVDLARGHVAALEHLTPGGKMSTYNLGTGHGTSVFQAIRAFEAASGVRVPYEVVDRRPGDVAVCFADVSKAERELDWKATKTLEEACADSWRWQKNNPRGFAPISELRSGRNH